MPRKQLIRNTELPYHVVNRAIDEKWFPLSKERLWPIFCENALLISWCWGARIHALVLMNNHFHMVLSTPDGNLDHCMQDFQSEIARHMSLTLGTDGYRFQARYKWSLIGDPVHMANVVKYVYQNPLKAGICQRAEEFPCSTLHGIFGNSKLRFPIHAHPLVQAIYDDPSDDLLRWINQPFEKLVAERIQRGLRKNEFSLSEAGTSRSMRKQIQENLNCPFLR